MSTGWRHLQIHLIHKGSQGSPHTSGHHPLLYNPGIGPQTRGGPIASRDLGAAAGGPMASFGRNWLLAAQPGRRTARKRFLSTVGCSGLDSQGLATILGPFPTTFPDFGPCPLSDILTPLPFSFWFFSNSPNGYVRSNRTAILSLGVWSI